MLSAQGVGDPGWFFGPGQGRNCNILKLPARPDSQQAVRVLFFRPLLAANTQQPLDFTGLGGIQQLNPPTKALGGQRQGSQGVPHIMLAVSEGPFPVFPGFPPVNTGQTGQKRPLGQVFGKFIPFPRFQDRPLLQDVPLRSVVENARGVDQVPLRRVQISTGGINPQRPARNHLAPGRNHLFPGGQGQAEIEKFPNRFQVHRSRIRALVEKSVPTGLILWFGPIQGDDFHSVKMSEGIRLIGPIQPAQRPRVSLKMVFGFIVIAVYCIQLCGQIFHIPFLALGWVG